MPYRYRAEKSRVDEALRRLSAKDRAKVVKSYRIIADTGEVEVEVTKQLEELEG